MLSSSLDCTKCQNAWRTERSRVRRDLVLVIYCGFACYWRDLILSSFSSASRMPSESVVSVAIGACVSVNLNHASRPCHPVQIGRRGVRRLFFRVDLSGGPVQGFQSSKDPPVIPLSQLRHRSFVFPSRSRVFGRYEVATCPSQLVMNPSAVGIPHRVRRPALAGRRGANQGRLKRGEHSLGG